MGLTSRIPCDVASGHREHTRVSAAGSNFDHPLLEEDLPDWALNAFDEFAADSRESEALMTTSDITRARPYSSAHLYPPQPPSP
jgi:hypothetical protein